MEIELTAEVVVETTIPSIVKTMLAIKEKQKTDESLQLRMFRYG